jgi:hypothetical protein
LRSSKTSTINASVKQRRAPPEHASEQLQTRLGHTDA